MGPLFALVGAFLLYLGVMVWIRPNSSLVQRLIVNGYPAREQAGPVSRFFGLTRECAGVINLWLFRLLVGPVNGTVFFCAGIWVTFNQILCGLQH
jgi:hypothetical protein